MFFPPQNLSKLLKREQNLQNNFPFYAFASMSAQMWPKRKKKSILSRKQHKCLYLHCIQCFYSYRIDNKFGKKNRTHTRFFANCEILRERKKDFQEKKQIQFRLEFL